MANVSIIYNCGCGFKTADLSEAVEHSDKNNHTLTVNGLIKKER